MKISTEKPPIYDEADKVFNFVKEGFEPVFTYGDTLYNPFNITIPQDLMVHEQTHAKQHEYNTAVAHIWWIKYLEDPEFRLEQEVAAYASQYRFICATHKDRNIRNKYLRGMATLLSGPLYKCDVTFHRAMECIKVGRLDTAKRV